VALSLVVLNDEAKPKESIKLSTKLTVNEKLDTFVLTNTDLQTTTEGEAIPGKSISAALTIADVALDMPKQTANISGLMLKSGDVALSAEISGTMLRINPPSRPCYRCTIQPLQLYAATGHRAACHAGCQCLSSLAINFDLQATADSADLQNLVMTLDDTILRVPPALKTLRHPLSF